MPDALKDALDLAQNVGGILLLVFYASIVLWSYKDARRRIDDPILVATAVATSMLPIVGVLVYMMLRPPEYLADVRERELEIRAMERTLGRQERCPYCRSHIESDFRSCPVCMGKLRQSCTGCDQPLDPRWAMCPFCETEVARPVTDARGRGKRVDKRSEPATSPAHKPSPSHKSTPPPMRSTPSRPSEPPASPKRDNGSGTDGDKPGPGDKPGDTITTEPFQAARQQRFVSTHSQPTMISGPGLGTGGDRG